MARQIFLDTETTGISYRQGHRVIEVGCLEAIDRKLTNNHFHYYINPERDIDAGAMRVHGLTEEFLQDKPKFKEIAQELVDFIKGAEIIIHNAPFDVGFLDRELGLVSRRHKGIESYATVIDSLVMARQKHPGQKNSLDALCKRYAIDNAHRDLHGALLDAELLAQVYFRMTGGQAQLFVGVSDSSKNEQKLSSSENVTNNAPSLPSSQLSAEETQQHQEYLESMSQQGDCVWLDKA
jgi:DNA polymerase III subunit epsilon